MPDSLSIERRKMLALLGAELVRVMRILGGWPTWTTVRAFGSVKYFNISYGVLFIVPILHELYDRAVPAMIWLGSPAPFPTTLRWLYAASFLYAVAIAIYQYFCPAEIKRFGKEEEEYVRTQYKIYRRAMPNHRLNVVLAHLDPVLDEGIQEKISSLLMKINNAIAPERKSAQIELDELVEHLHPDAIQRFLLKEYENKNISKTAARFVSYLLYVAGTAIILILLIVRSYGVLFEGREQIC